MALALTVNDLGRRLGDHAVDTPGAEFRRTACIVSRFALRQQATIVSLLEPSATRPGLLARIRAEQEAEAPRAIGSRAGSPRCP